MFHPLNFIEAVLLFIYHPLPKDANMYGCKMIPLKLRMKKKKSLGDKSAKNKL